MKGPNLIRVRFIKNDENFREVPAWGGHIHALRRVPHIGELVGEPKGDDDQGRRYFKVQDVRTLLDYRNEEEYVVLLLEL